MNFIRKYLFLTTIVILISVVFSLHHLMGFWTLGENYLPFSSNSKLSYLEEETYIYAAHVNHLQSGYLRGDPYVWEYRNSSSPFFSEIASILPIFFLSLSFGSPSRAFIFSDFIFPVVLFLIIYFGLRQLRFEKKFSIVAAAAVIIIPFFSMILPDLQSYGTYLTGASEHSLFFSRTPHPQISSVYLFASLLLTTLILKNPSSKIIYLWAIVVGSSVYASPFVASTVGVAQLLIFTLLFKKIGLSRLFLPVLLIMLIASPFLINFFQLQSLLKNSDFFLRTTFPRQFLFPLQLRYISIGLVLILVRRDSLSKIIFAYILAASILTDGHQLIFGRNIEADHWLSRILAPLGTLTLLILFRELINRLNINSTKILWPAFTLIIYLIGTSTQLSWLQKNWNDFINKDEESTIINKIIDNTPKDSVVGSLSPVLSRHITGFTGRKVYIAPGDRTLVSSNEQTIRICDIISLLPKEKGTVNRDFINYAFGFEVWFKHDVSNIEKSIDDCSAENHRKPKYKLDYLLERDPDTNEFYIKSIDGKVI